MKKLIHFSARVLLVALACCFSLTAYAQKTSVSGVVVDENGTPLLGASVVVVSGEKILGGELLLTCQVHLQLLLSQDRLLTSHSSATRMSALLLLLRRTTTAYSSL